MGPGDVSGAYPYISPYFQGGYMTHQQAPINIPYTPFVAVIDLETGEALDMDLTMSDYMMPADVVTACNTANAD